MHVYTQTRDIICGLGTCINTEDETFYTGTSPHIVYTPEPLKSGDYIFIVVSDKKMTFCKERYITRLTFHITEQ